MDVSRTKRVVAAIINIITLHGLIVGGIIALSTKRTSIGGLVMGYTFNDGSLVMLFFTKILAGILSFFTLSIFFWIDVFTMGNRNGTFAESWAGVHKA